MKIQDIIERGLIMPQTIKPMGLIHLPGKGPNNRFDFKNKGNNKNVLLIKDMNSKNDREMSLGCTGCRELHLKRFSVCPSSQLN